METALVQGAAPHTFQTFDCCINRTGLTRPGPPIVNCNINENRACPRRGSPNNSTVILLYEKRIGLTRPDPHILHTLIPFVNSGRVLPAAEPPPLLILVDFGGRARPPERTR